VLGGATKDPVSSPIRPKVAPLFKLIIFSEPATAPLFGGQIVLPVSSIHLFAVPLSLTTSSTCSITTAC